MLEHDHTAKHLRQPQRTSQGFFFTEPGFQGLTGCLFVATVFWWSITFHAFADFLSFFISPSFAIVGFVLFFGLFGGIGMILSGVTMRMAWVLFSFKPGKLTLTRYPLRIGEIFAVEYRRELRYFATAAPSKIRAKWQCHEWAQKGAGKYRKHKIHPIWEKELPVKVLPKGLKRLEYDAELQVLWNHPPSFYAANNQIRWQLTVTVEPYRGPTATSSFQLEVVPESLT